ncbi:MAG: hypothetical protein ACQET6_06245 [Bacillota bacterium]|uniref:hypothetical protein n=1 Tax=Rossellomorea sp. FM04394 TaxID=3243076 RepID=UPI0035A6371D
MDRFVLLMLAGILAGFVLTEVPLAGTFLASVATILSLIGVVAMVVFSLYLIYKGVLAILGR